MSIHKGRYVAIKKVHVQHPWYSYRTVCGLEIEDNIILGGSEGSGEGVTCEECRDFAMPWEIQEEEVQG